MFVRGDREKRPTLRPGHLVKAEGDAFLMQRLADPVAAFRRNMVVLCNELVSAVASLGVLVFSWSDLLFPNIYEPPNGLKSAAELLLRF